MGKRHFTIKGIYVLGCIVGINVARDDLFDCDGYIWDGVGLRCRFEFIFVADVVGINEGGCDGCGGGGLYANKRWDCCADK